MPSFMSLSSSFLGLLFSTSAMALIMTPFSDGQCQEPITNATIGTDKAPLIAITLTHGISDSPSADRFYYPSFPGAEGQDEAAGYNVWWYIPEPDPGCKIYIMKPVEDGVASDVAINGAAMAVASKSGCYYTHIDAYSEFSTTFCCGEGDCDRADIKLQDPPKSDTPAATALPQAKRDKIPVPAGSGGPSCKVSNTLGEPYTRKGRQVRVSDVCGGASCQFSAAKTFTHETTLSSETTQSFEIGTEVTVSAGANVFGVDTELAVSQSVSQAWETATGHEWKDSVSFSMTQTLTPYAGVHGFLSYMPGLQCWNSTMDCDGKETPSLEYCIAVPNEGAGSYQVVADGF